ncbi:LPS export ABC transporter permease LptG [Phreatobacter sp.]|uniref:LPS export ABC transporter permease LptG n=1 Tax=Phreatobacter sp. TaxID=1966341 RepID=UPI003F7141CB
MTLVSTFSRYMTWKFLAAVGGTFLGTFSLVLAVDFVEQLRRVEDFTRSPTAMVALLALYRVPAFVEIILPFAVLVGAMLCFLGLSRKLELVVARAAGLSAWQFLTPAILTAALIGVAATTLYNPMASDFRERSMRLETQLFGRLYFSEQRSDFWIRQATGDGQAVINAASATERGRILNNVSVLVFSEQGQFRQRIDAESAALGDGHWLLSKVRITPVDREATNHESHVLPTQLTATQVQQSFVMPEQVSFWDLPQFIEIARRTGLPSARFELQYQLLLARPLLLVAMVLVAAAATLRFARLGGLGRTILGGVVAGFLLYVGSELAGNLGRTNLVPPVLAAWSPAFLGALMGFMVLLKQEDG